jgi:tRNA (guanine-N7-)-methyltransferase
VTQTDPPDDTAEAAQTARRRTLYGRRKGKRLRPGQQDMLDQALPRLSIAAPKEGESLDPRALFPDKRAVWLEIGFGAGEHLIWQAQQNPDVGLIGCEPFINGLARALTAAVQAGLSNIRFLQDDARLLLRALPDKSLGRAFILFPDPWPKLRHHKRRLVATPTLDLLARALVDDAELRLATDDASYLPWMVEHATRHPAFDWLAEGPSDWRRRPADWPPTRYEQKALRQGRRPAYLRLVRRPR